MTNNDDDERKRIEIEIELEKLRVLPAIRPDNQFEDVPNDAPSADVDYAPEPPDYQPAGESS
jgi:hypothetical protein